MEIHVTPSAATYWKGGTMITVNPYRVGEPIQSQVSLIRAVLSGNIISPAQWRNNEPLTQTQADRLYQYSKKRYPHLHKLKR